MMKLPKLRRWTCDVLIIGALYFGHCFVVRASDFEFLTEKMDFSVKHYIWSDSQFLTFDV